MAVMVHRGSDSVRVHSGINSCLVLILNDVAGHRENIVSVLGTDLKQFTGVYIILLIF